LVNVYDTSKRGKVEDEIYSCCCNNNNNNTTTNTSRPFKQTLSPKSKEIVGKLSGLFAIDSFAGGFVIQSIVSFWFFTKFGVELTTLSFIFSIAGVLTALSFLVAAKLADRIGLINTMEKKIWPVKCFRRYFL
jgi:hypothetical protein